MRLMNRAGDTNRGNWQQEYNKKICTPEEALSVIRDHDTIAMAGGNVVPEALVKALSQKGNSWQQLSLLVNFALKRYDFMDPSYKENFSIETAFVGPMERNCIQEGISSYVPIHLQQLGHWLDYRKPNVVACSVTPPDADGYMNRSCYAGLCHRRAFEKARTVIVEVNQNLPWLCGDDFKIHVSEVDYIIENNYEPVETQDIPITQTEKLIAAHIADMIDNGSTIQLGLGGLANAVGYFLRDKRNLGVHGEVISNSIMDLLIAGAVDGSRKSLHRGKVLGCYLVGNRKLWDFVDRNEDFLFCEVEYINDPRVIAQNDNLISINNTLMVDLTGQAASESIGTYQYSGTGGQVNFVQGATQSRGGKSILALSSTYQDKEGQLRSKIVPVFPEGTIVSTSRNDVEYIVTEYGVACLKWKSLAERVKELIRIAHPDFRSQLKFAAAKNHWI